MKCLAAPILVLAVWFAPAAAGPGEPYETGASGPSEVLLQAMRDELQRTVERLRLEGLSKPYFVAYTVLESHKTELKATFGGLERPRDAHSRTLQAEIRVGSREFDDTHFVGAQNRNFRPRSKKLTVEDDYDVLREQMWALSDEVYKTAVQRFAGKTVYKESKNIKEDIPDLSEDPVRSSRETSDPGGFEAGWEKSLRRISAVFREYPEVQSSSAKLTWRVQHLYFVDSEGRSYVKPVHRVELEMKASSLAEDGMAQTGRRDLLFAGSEQIPPLEQLEATAAELARGVTELAHARQIETYLGPVLLEGQAAGEFFNQLLADGLSAPRKPWVEQSWAEQYFKAGELTGRLGLRVVAPVFDVADDPTLESFNGKPLAGHYKVDEQGIPAERVELIERGILRDLLMGRSPTKDRKRSNGHGRGAFATPAAGSVGNLIVTPRETAPLDSLLLQLRREAEAFGLEYGLRISRIGRQRSRGENDLLAAPLMVYRVDTKSGKQTLVRDAQFTSITLRALRDVVAASDQQIVYNLSKPGPFNSAGTLRTAIVHPSILLSEMELTRTDKKPTKPPYLPHPYFD